tara:strand:+ start:2806 stop:4896 length:2091 start_codon:yes stop_codon:yes gene_type:complete
MGCIKKIILDDFIKKNPIKNADIIDDATIYNSINTCLNDNSDYLAITYDTKNNKNIAFGITFKNNTKTKDFEDIVSDRNKVWNRDFTSPAWTKNTGDSLKIKLTNENYMMIFKLKNEITRVGYLTYSVDDLKTNNHGFINVDYSNLENKTVDIKTTSGNAPSKSFPITSVVSTNINKDIFVLAFSFSTIGKPGSFGRKQRIYYNQADSTLNTGPRDNHNGIWNLNITTDQILSRINKIAGGSCDLKLDSSGKLVMGTSPLKIAFFWRDTSVKIMNAFGLKRTKAVGSNETTQISTDTETPKRNPVNIGSASNPPQACEGDYGSNIACCGQSKHQNSVRHEVRCPVSSPTCVGYVYGSNMGYCTVPPPVTHEVINPSKQVLTKYKTITNLPIAFLIAMQNDYEVVLVNKSNNGDDPIIYTGKVDSIMSDCQIDIVVGSANPFHGHVQQNKPDGGQYFEVYLRPDLISKDYISKNPVCNKNKNIQYAHFKEMATDIYRINANISYASHLSPGTSQKNNILNSMYSGMSPIEVPAYDNSIERFDTTIEDFTLSQSEQKTNIDNYFNDANKNIGQKSKNLKSQYQDQLDKLTKSTDDKTDYINTLQTLENNKQSTIKSNYSSIQNINKKLYKLNSNIESTTTKYEYNKNMVSMMRVLLVCLIIFMLLMIAYYGVKKAYGSKITEKLHEATTKMKSKFNHH